MRYRFTDFVLDTNSLELSENNAPVHSEPQVIELLVYFVQNNQRLVTREEIYAAVWHGRIVSEAALSSRIKTLRQLLGDNGKTQRIIRTVHKRGFRFVAEVREIGGSREESSRLLSENTSEITPSNSSELPVASADLTGYDKPVIAVLPFHNISCEEEQEYFADAITADIITHLSKHRWLQVIARNTMLGFKNKSIDPRTLAKDLSANYIVEGNVRKAGNRFRISVNLVDAISGHQIWSDRYDRVLDDMFDLQDEITEIIVARLEPEIGFSERNRIAASRPPNLRAWDAFHLGIHHFYRFTGDDNIEAQKLLKLSQELDPNFGEAFAWWAYSVILGMVYWDTKPTNQLMDEALSACDKALLSDPQNASFHALKARIQVARCEYSSGLTENQIAIKLNPTLAAAHCGLGDSLAYEGNYDKAMPCFDRAIAMSPNDPQLWAFYSYAAQALIFKKDFVKALHYIEQASAMPNHQYWTTAHKLVALTYLGMKSEKKQTLQKLLQQNPKFSLSFAREKLFYLKLEEQINTYMHGLEIAGVPKKSD